MDFLEQTYGMETSETIIDKACPDGNSSFTAVGNYSFDHMLDFVVASNEVTEQEVSDILKAFGLYLFPKLIKQYGGMLGEINHSYEMIECIEDHIHVEVKKLYPNAELPTFKTEKNAEGVLKLEYRSARPLAKLAEGLLLGCCKHFKNDVDIECHDLEISDGYAAIFTLKERNA